MLKKLRAEAITCRYGFRAALWLILSVIVCGAFRYEFCEKYPGAGGAELPVWVLTDHNYVLMILTIMVLAFTVGRGGETCRYPVLLRQESRDRALAVRLGVPMAAGVLGLLTQTGILLILGWGLPRQKKLFPMAESPSRVLVCQLLNIACYIFVILFLREIIRQLVRNAGLEFFCTMLLPMAARAAVLNYRTRAVLISPWGSIAYLLAFNLPGRATADEFHILREAERADYRFFWQYWLAVLLVLLGIAVWLERRRDYVWEQDRRAG